VLQPYFEHRQPDSSAGGITELADEPGALTSFPRICHKRKKNSACNGQKAGYSKFLKLERLKNCIFEIIHVIFPWTDPMRLFPRLL